MRAHLKGILGVNEVEAHVRYLGLPALVGRSKKLIFSFLKERIWKKLKGWKEKALSNAGKEVLIKSITQAIPTYVMSCYALPKTFCEEIQSMISRFWWGSMQNENKIHWVRWEDPLGKMG